MSRADGDRAGVEYQVTGQGRPAVLLHGFPDSGRLWRYQVPALAAGRGRVPGHRRRPARRRSPAASCCCPCGRSGLAVSVESKTHP
jgi:pimeloyl-ACP methyl ester carboxylesterase